uniref:Uncharacterized protein n=1 Tax=Oryza sativa subsp. indica TaxID=39946 RepID=A0A679BAP3_ORYSI|nr:hypothetical protein [Oryza sativa Indica Group]
MAAVHAKMTTKARGDTGGDSPSATATHPTSPPPPRCRSSSCRKPCGFKDGGDGAFPPFPWRPRRSAPTTSPGTAAAVRGVSWSWRASSRSGRLRRGGMQSGGGETATAVVAGWCRHQARGPLCAGRRGRRRVTPGQCGRWRIRSPPGRIRPSSPGSDSAAAQGGLWRLGGVSTATRRAAGLEVRGSGGGDSAPGSGGDTGGLGTWPARWCGPPHGAGGGAAWGRPSAAGKPSRCLKGGAGAGAAAFPVLAQAEMVVQREQTAIWREARRVVERRGPWPALRDGGSMKSADGEASVRCGGGLVIGRLEAGRRRSVGRAWWKPYAADV